MGCDIGSLLGLNKVNGGNLVGKCTEELEIRREGDQDSVQTEKQKYES